MTSQEEQQRTWDKVAMRNCKAQSKYKSKHNPKITVVVAESTPGDSKSNPIRGLKDGGPPPSLLRRLGAKIQG